MKSALVGLALVCAWLGLVFHRVHGRLCLVSIWLIQKTGEPMPPEIRAEQLKIRESLKGKA